MTAVINKANLNNTVLTIDKQNEHTITLTENRKTEQTKHGTAKETKRQINNNIGKRIPEFKHC